MPKGTFQIKYEKLVMDNLDLKERIEDLEADIKIKQSVCETIEKELTEINEKLRKRIAELEKENEQTRLDMHIKTDEHWSNGYEIAKEEDNKRIKELEEELARLRNLMNARA